MLYFAYLHKVSRFVSQQNGAMRFSCVASAAHFLYLEEIKMKKAKWLLVGLIMAICIVSIGAYASNGTVNKMLSYNNIKITLDGKEIRPTDAGGNYVEPFIIEGTTYLPVRGVASALGLDVEWDANTKTVKLSTNGSATANNLYSDLKNWIVKNGTTNGDYVYFLKSADNYGGRAGHGQ